MARESPELRRMIAREGALVMHSRHDGKEITRAAHDAAEARFLRLVDPDGTLPEKERERRARLLYRAFMVRISRLGVQRRQEKRQRQRVGK